MASRQSQEAGPTAARGPQLATRGLLQGALQTLLAARPLRPRATHSRLPVPAPLLLVTALARLLPTWGQLLAAAQTSWARRALRLLRACRR